MASVTVINQDIYQDGSGISGLYQVYGLKLSGIHTGEKITVTPLNIRPGYRGRGEKETLRTAVRAVEQHLVGLMPLN